MKSPVTDQKSFQLPHHLVLSDLDVGMEKRVRLILLEKLIVPLLVQDDP